MDNMKIINLPYEPAFFKADLTVIKLLQEDLDTFQRLVRELINSVLVRCVPLKCFFKTAQGYDATILHIINQHVDAFFRLGIGDVMVKLKRKFLQDLKDLRKDSLEAFDLIVHAINQGDPDKVVKVAKALNAKMHRLEQYLSQATHKHQAKIIQCKKGATNDL